MKKMISRFFTRFFKLLVDTSIEHRLFEYVYVNQDGTVRELSPKEKELMTEKFHPGDGGRPYIKRKYTSLDGWGSQSGFLLRKRVPSEQSILSVRPRYDEDLEKVSSWRTDHIEDAIAVGDKVARQVDGSTRIEPNKEISNDKRFETYRQLQLARQRKYEALARQQLEGQIRSLD
jgi:hypothetical protein